MSNYTVRKLQNTEFDLLIPLMKDCFGMNVDLGYFEWKFVKNPSGFVLGFIAVSNEGEVAAYYGVIPESYVLGGDITTIYQSCDTMTHSRHRRQGLFQKLALHCYDHLRIEGKLFVIGFGGWRSTPGLLKFGWQKSFDVKNYFFPNFFSWMKGSSPKNMHISEISNYAEIENLIYISNRCAAYHSHKTLEVFKWRLSNPMYDYKVIGYKHGKDKTYTSYLCYYCTANKLVLFDFYFRDSIASKALVGHLKKLAKEPGLKGIITFCQEKSDYSKILQKRGFIYNPFSSGPLSVRAPFMFYTYDESMAKYNNPRKWLINSFDHDAM
jgi:hypothetical protein